MKTFNYLLILFLLSSCVAAQNFQLITASHTTRLGGVKGARAEKFDIVIKENPQLEVKYLLVGNVRIDLIKKNIGGTVHLSGLYFPEKQPSITQSGEVTTVKNDFNLDEAFLVSTVLNTKKEISQKINFSKNSKNEESISTEDVPE